MLPASILALHSHPLVLQRALYLSYSKANIPWAFISPQNMFTLSSAMSDASVWSSVPQDICPLFRSLVSAIPRLDARPLSSCSRHDASRDGPRAPRHPLSSAALFVSPRFRQNPSSGSPCALEFSYLICCHLGCLHLGARPPRTSVHCWNTLWSFASCPLATSWRHHQSLWPPRDFSDPCDDANCSTRLFFKAIFVIQSGIFLFCLIACFYLVAGAAKMSVVSSCLLFGFSEKAIAFFCLYLHISCRVFLWSFAIYFSSIYLGVSRAAFIQFPMFLVFPLFFFPFSVLWNSPSCLKGVSQRDLRSGSESSAVDSK